MSDLKETEISRSLNILSQLEHFKGENRPDALVFFNELHDQLKKTYKNTSTKSSSSKVLFSVITSLIASAPLYKDIIVPSNSDLSINFLLK